jgi:hypothetical protein
MLILKAVSLGPLRGYGAGQRIMRMSEGALCVEEGALLRKGIGSGSPGPFSTLFKLLEGSATQCSG